MKRIVLSLTLVCYIVSVMAQTHVSGEIAQTKQTNFRHTGCIINIGAYAGPNNFAPSGVYLSGSYGYYTASKAKFYSGLQLSFGYQFGSHFSMSLGAFVDMWNFECAGHQYSYAYYDVYTHSYKYEQRWDKEYPKRAYKPFHPGVEASFKYYLLNRKNTPFIGLNPGVIWDFKTSTTKENNQITTKNSKNMTFNGKLYIGLATGNYDVYIGWDYIPDYPKDHMSSFLFGCNARLPLGHKSTND